MRNGAMKTTEINLKTEGDFVKKEYHTPHLVVLSIKETKGGYFDWEWEAPEWLPISHS
jgi:uncharacterized protein involved in tolerance to divalent cations